MTSLTITLPDDVAKLAEEKGLLSTVAITALVHEAALRETTNASGEGNFPLPPGYEPWMKGKVSPELFGRGEILGDIVSPIDVEWEVMK